MKKIIPIICYGFLLPAISCSNAGDQQTADAYTISGRITGIPNGSVKLVSYNEADRTTKTLDSVVFSNDSFTIKGKLDYPQIVSVIIEPGNWSFSFFAENSSIKVNIDTTGSEHFDWTADGGSVAAYIKKFSITGSKSQDDYMQYQNDKGLKAFDAVFADLNKKFETVSGKDIDAEYRVRDEMDSVNKLLQQKQMKYVTDYVKKNPASSVGAYLLSQVYLFIRDKPLAETDSILSMFTGDAKNSIYYKNVTSSQDKIKALLPGKTAPDFTLLKRDSSKFTLSSMRGNYTMIDFWASWCHPCREAIPHWKEIYKKYHSRGFDILGVSDDNRWADWFKAMDQEKMPWQQVCDEFPFKYMPARVGTLYMTAYIPFYVLLDKEGKILVYSSNEQDINNKLKEIFGS